MVVYIIFGVKICSRAIFPKNRSWVYDRLHLNRGIKPRFYKGVEQFLSVSCQTQPFVSERKVSCTCSKCKCRKCLGIETIRYHLFPNMGSNLIIG